MSSCFKKTTQGDQKTVEDVSNILCQLTFYLKFIYVCKDTVLVFEVSLIRERVFVTKDLKVVFVSNPVTEGGRVPTSRPSRTTRNTRSKVKSIVS